MAFWGKKKQPPVVSCFGKLPATGDFIRLNASAHENQTFVEWLQTSVALAKDSLGERFKTCYEPALGVFVYRGDDGDGSEEPERGLVGAWAASRDSAGRSYPMLVSTAYDYDELLAVGPALPLATWAFLQPAYDLVANGRNLTVDNFLGRVQHLAPAPLDNPEASVNALAQWQGAQTMRSLWETTYGTIDKRHAVVQGILATIEIFQGQERPQTQLALRLPVGAGDAYAAAVWLDMTLRLGQWKRTVLNAFWTPQHDVMIHIGPLQRGTFREVIVSGTDADHVTDLVRPTATEATARQGLGKLAALVDDTDMTIAAFMQGLT